MIRLKSLDEYTHAQRRKMPLEQYTSTLMNTLFSAIDDPKLYDKFFVNDIGGHSEIHFGKTPNQLADRLIETNSHSKAIPGSSTFHSATEAKEIILNAMIFKSADIAKWYKGRQVDMGEEAYRRFRFDLDMRTKDPYGIGIGLDDKFREKTTDTVTISLIRDRIKEGETFYNSPLGIYIETAFPNINSPEAKFTGRQFDPRELIEDRKGSMNALEKAELLFRGKLGDMMIAYSPEDVKYPDHLYLELKKPNFYFSAIVTDESTKMRIRDSKGSKRIGWGQLQQEHPAIASTVSRVANSVHMFEKGTIPEYKGHRFNEQHRVGYDTDVTDKSPLEKTVDYLKGQHEGVTFRFEPSDRKLPERIRFDAQGPDYRFTASMTRDNTKMWMTKGGHTRPISMFALNQSYPEIARAISSVKNTYHSFENNKEPAARGSEIKKSQNTPEK